MSASQREYATRLEGEPHDLSDLRRSYAVPGPIRVTQIVVGGETVTALYAADFSGLASGAEVLEVSGVIVNQMNGALLISANDRRPVRPTIVYDRIPGGVWSAGTNHMVGTLDVAQARVRADATVTQPGGTPIQGAPSTDSTSKWLAFARSGTPDGDRVNDVLTALSGDPDWADLWRAQEMFHHDRLGLQGWNEAESERFRQSATLYRHSPNSANGNRARDWFTRTGAQKMDISTARRVVLHEAKLWLGSKVP
jgi:hypothetical protein